MTLPDALVAYKTYARAEGKSPKTVSWVTSCVGYFADFLGPDGQDIASITGNDLRRFIIALQEKHRYSHHPYNKALGTKLAPQTVLTYCHGIEVFFSFLTREGFIDTNPIAKVKLPKVPQTVVPTLSEKEAERLLAQPDKSSSQGFRDYCILLTLIDTAVRLSELANLKAEDIDYEQNMFRVMGKGQRERYVPFGRRVARALMRYQLKCRPQPVGTNNFWLKRDGQPLPASRIQKLVSMYGKRAGLRVYCHKLRHTSSVMFLRNGGGEFSLQRKLGHRSLVMTRRYSNLADTDVIGALKKYGGLGKLEGELGTKQEQLEAMQEEIRKRDTEIKKAGQRLGQLQKETMALGEAMATHKRLVALGFDEGALSELNKAAAKYGRPPDVLSAINSYGALSDIEKTYQDMQERVQRETAALESLEAKHSHLKSAIEMCRKLLHDYKFGFDGISMIVTTASTYGEPIEVLKALEAYGKIEAISTQIEQLNLEAVKIEAKVEQLKKTQARYEARNKTILDQLEMLNAKTIEVGRAVGVVEEQLRRDRRSRDILQLLENPVSAKYEEYGPLVLVLGAAIQAWVNVNKAKFAWHYTINDGLEKLAKDLGGR